jgi:hypothetical protein
MGNSWLSPLLLSVKVTESFTMWLLQGLMQGPEGPAVAMLTGWILPDGALIEPAM